MTTDKVKKDILHGADFIRLLKSLRPRWYGHVERRQNQRMSKQTAAATMEGTMKSGRPRKGWTEFAYNGNLKKKKAGSGHRPSGMEENCIESE